MDKALLSKLVSLEQFGYYALAGSVAALLWAIIVPLNAAVFPRFCQLSDAQDEAALADLYHRVCQYMNLAIAPCALTIGLFSYDAVLIWTRNSAAAEHAHVLISILIAGTAINGLVSVAGSLQAASGWPQLMMYTNCIASLVLVPMMWFMATRYGAIGAAVVWLILNSGYFAVQIPIMHRRILTREKWRWYCQDVGVPLGGGFVLGVICRRLAPPAMSLLEKGIYIWATWLLLAAAVGLSSPHIRRAALRSLRTLRQAPIG